VTDTPPPDPARPAGREVQYKGAPLDAAKGPGLGCFWIQLVALAILVVLAPLSAAWGWPPAATGTLLIAMLFLLLVAGQTVIFLLRIVAADRRTAGRRRPLGATTRTVGELEDSAGSVTEADSAGPASARDSAAHVIDAPPAGEPPDGGVRE
jgi:hypothetical protein